jgi:preprotein translocase subunit Sec61beta
MLRRTGTILLGIVLLPFCIGFSWQLAVTAIDITYKPLIPYWFTGGFLLYLIIHFLFKQPILSYVIGHELTHAFFAVLFGGSVKAFHASEKGGRVHLTKSNFVITLAPYFFPLYTFFALVAIWLARAANAPALEPWLVLVAGAAFAFHIVLTAIFLQTDQNDIREHGAFFSYPLIFLFNIILTALLIRLLLAQDMNYPAYLFDGIMRSIRLFVLGCTKLYGWIMQ